jgi:pimeloyl-ACP methyl ester carboxylesterase
MGFFFKDDLQDALTWAAGYIPYGGADLGEIRAVAETVGDGDAGEFNRAWVEAGDRLVERARAALAAGKRASARDAFMRGSCHYASSYRPLFGKPVDPRLLAAFGKQIAAFNEGLALFDPPVTPLQIPFDGQSMPAYFLPAQGRAKEVRPLMILTNGYDATVTDMYFASAVAASQRGYHCLFFDGPGQGEMLFEHDVHIRPDWEKVIAPVVDFALQFDEVDPKRIALMGWSFGGYLASRAASGETRIAACIADPGLFGAPEMLRPMLQRLGASPEAVRDLGNVDDAILNKFEQMQQQDRHLRWTIAQRAFWVHGVDTLRQYVAEIQLYTLSGRVESIACPTLLTVAENDPLAATAQQLFEALRGPKALITFSAAEGAGTHVEAFNRSLLNSRVYDWLDGVFEK